MLAKLQANTAASGAATLPCRLAEAHIAARMAMKIRKKASWTLTPAVSMWEVSEALDGSLKSLLS